MNANKTKPIFESYLNILDYKEIPSFLNNYLSVPSLIRLKKVGYFCGMDYASKDIYDFTEYISRYDHSLSVALITWKYTKDKIATIAGLFHDIGTPVFSHTIDYMNKDYEKQESTEEYTREIVLSDNKLLNCLKEDKILPEQIINFKNYSIVDNDRPRLCADRLDGILLTSLYWTKKFTIDDVKIITSDIAVYINEDNQKELGFKTLEIAKKVFEANETIDAYCHSNSDTYMMALLASITENAIQKNYFNYKDLYRLNEEEIFNILKSKGNDKLIKFRTIKKTEIPIINISNIKKRNINPLVNGTRYNKVFN